MIIACLFLLAEDGTEVKEAIVITHPHVKITIVVLINHGRCGVDSHIHTIHKQIYTRMFVQIL